MTPDDNGRVITSAFVHDLFLQIDAALPQTQCTRCGYPDCAAYAQAMASAAAPINQCPPGGAEGIARLAAITGRPAEPLNPDFGTEGPRFLAVIDEDWCIGCTLCIKACPTEAILGSNKTMHTVIEPWCTGCELCIPVCPVDCISLENASGDRTGWAAWSPELADTASSRYRRHQSLRDRHDETGTEAAGESAAGGEALPARTESTAAPSPAANAWSAAIDPSTSGSGRSAATAGTPPGAAAQPGVDTAGTADAADVADAAAERKRAMIEAALAKARARHNTRNQP